MKLVSRSVVEIAPVIDVAPVARDATDDGLVARAQRGDQRAFEKLIEGRAERLLRMASVILGNEADAYEAAQEALIAAWIGLPGLRDSTRFDAWLNRTLVNKCRDALRRRGRVRDIRLESTEIAVVDTNELRLQQTSLLAAFDRLSPGQRQILVMHHIDQMRLDEIARQLGVPVGTAKSRLWGARRALERSLEAES